MSDALPLIAVQRLHLFLTVTITLVEPRHRVRMELGVQRLERRFVTRDAAVYVPERPCDPCGVVAALGAKLERQDALRLAVVCLFTHFSPAFCFARGCRSRERLELDARALRGWVAAVLRLRRDRHTDPDAITPR